MLPPEFDAVYEVALQRAHGELVRNLLRAVDIDEEDDENEDEDEDGTGGYGGGPGDFAESDEGDRDDADHEDDLGDLGDDDEVDFADPEGRSALRAASRTNPRIFPCPTCRQPNRLTAQDVSAGYQCDTCADNSERGRG